MAKTSFTFTHSRAGDYKGTASMGARNVVARIVNFITGCQTGAFGASGVETATTAASGTVTFSSFSTSFLFSIGGVELPELDAGGTDAESASLLAALISDSANGVSDVVTASVDGAVVTITSKYPGLVGNFISLGGSATGVTLSGSSLSGGASNTYTF